LQLKRLNAEAAARAKRQRRRANEIKTKTIRRMQLQMTTPMDIGLEQTDLALSFGQDDIFNFNDDLERKGGFIDDDRDLSPQSDLDEDVISELDDDEAFIADEEPEGQTVELEAELEGLYDAYQERLKEKDAKLRAREARKKNKEREEWGGISAAEKDGHSDDEDTAGGEDGGWEEMQEAKDIVGEESSSEGSVDGDASVVGTKRKTTSGEVSFNKRVRFATDLKEKPAASRATQLWFSQDIFSGIKGLDGDKLDSEPSSLRAVVRASQSHQVVGPKQDEVSICSTQYPYLSTDNRTGPFGSE
jgi:AdoMet-dependent rRNA methyltransferase SPB1